jgi:hypothetical protein
MATIAGGNRRIVRFRSGEAQLEGALESPGIARGAVVFAHGSGSSRMSPRNRFVASERRRAGFATLLSDLLAEEEDAQGTHRFDIELLSRRLRAAVDCLRNAPEAAGLPIALFGASTGAAAALREVRGGRAGATHLFEEPGALERVAALASDWLICHVRAEPRVEAESPIAKGASSW